MTEEEKKFASDWMRLVDSRIEQVETKVQEIKKDTSDVVAAFAAAQGAFKVLEWLGKLAKPLAWLSALVGLCAVAYTRLTSTQTAKLIGELFK